MTSGIPAWFYFNFVAQTETRQAESLRRFS